MVKNKGEGENTKKYNFKSVAEISYIDNDIVQLCDVLNTFEGFKTVLSCSGHEEGEPFKIWFVVDDSMDAWDSLGLLSGIIYFHNEVNVPNTKEAYLTERVKCELEGDGMLDEGKLLFYLYGGCDPNEFAEGVKGALEEAKREEEEMYREYLIENEKRCVTDEKE